MHPGTLVLRERHEDSELLSLFEDVDKDCENALYVHGVKKLLRKLQWSITGVELAAAMKIMTKVSLHSYYAPVQEQ